MESVDMKELIKDKLTTALIFNNVDFAIITSTDIEFQEVLKAVHPFIIDDIKDFFVLHYKNPKTELDYYFGSLAQLNICLVKSPEIGNMTQQGALFTISQLLKEVKPQNILMLGVCCGLERDSALAKNKRTCIYVANSITYYEYAKISEDYVVRSIVERPKGLLNIFTEEVSSETYQVKKGQYICGEKVLNNKKVKARLQKLYPGAVALDMESYSLALLANNIPYVVIKGASDFGVKKQGSKGQSATMKCVISYVCDCLEAALKIGLIKKYKPSLRIFISGCTEKKDASYSLFITKLAKKAYEHRYVIINGYGKGIGEHLILATREYAYLCSADHSNFLKIYPFPINNRLVSPEMYRNFATSNRNEMTSSSEISLFLFGDKNGEDEAAGVQDEYQCSLSAHNIIVPVGATCGEAAKIYQNYKSIIDIYQNPDLKSKYDKLKGPVDFTNDNDVNVYITYIFQYLSSAIHSHLINIINS